MSKRWRWLSLVCLIVIIVGAAVWWIPRQTHSSFEQEAESSETDAAAFLRASGIVVPAATIDIRASLAGTVQEVFADPGDVLPAGAVLLRLDDRLAAADLELALANVRQAGSQTDEVRARKQQAMEEVNLAKVRWENSQSLTDRSAAQELARAQAEQEIADSDVRRISRLVDGGAVQEFELQRARDQRTLAEFGVRLAEARLADQRVSLDHSQREAWQSIQLAEAAASVLLESVAVAYQGKQTAQASYERARLNLEAHRKTIPTEGCILERHVEVGEYVQPGTLLFELRSPMLVVRIEPDERELANLYVGREALVSPEAMPDRSFPVRVLRIAPAVDANRGTIEVFLSVPETVDWLIPNMAVSVEFAPEDSPL